MTKDTKGATSKTADEQIEEGLARYGVENLSEWELAHPYVHFWLYYEHVTVCAVCGEIETRWGNLPCKGFKPLKEVWPR